MEETSKRKWLGVLLSFIWTAILTPGVLLIFSVPTSEWLAYWLFYPFFVALLVMSDILFIPFMFRDAWKSSGDNFVKVVMIAVACAIVSLHSGLYFMASGGLPEFDVYETIFFIFMGTFSFVVFLILFVVALIWLIKLFIRLNKIVFFGKK